MSVSPCSSSASSPPQCPPRSTKGGGEGGSHAQEAPQLPRRSPLSAYDTLVQLGVPGHRAAKALVATGGRGVQIASDWLLAHVHDPQLDEDRPRLFTLYLCPSPEGKLASQLQTFWDASRVAVGWNGAHQSLPHLTLASAFACPDNGVDGLVTVIRRLAKDFEADFREAKQQGGFRLEKYVSQNYFGLFVGKREEILLRSFAQELSRALSVPPLSIQAEPMSKTHHLTLAYQFSPEQFDALEDLAASIDPAAETDWELRLYSFEERMKGMEVYKVLHPHEAKESDELELMVGDFVCVDPCQPSSEASASAEQGWFLGTSWLTGCKGQFPKNYVQRTSETNAWTCHLSLPVTKVSLTEEESRRVGGGGVLNPVSPQDLTKTTPTLLSSGASSCTSSLERLQSSCSSLNKHLASDHVTVGRTTSASSTSLVAPTTTAKSLIPPPNPLEPRKLYIARHGERVDFTFGSNWIPFCFSSDGSYTQKDLNLPVRVPRRHNAPESFLRDCPLTCVGMTQAAILGEALKNKGVTFSHAYVSPSLRCVQTCHALLKGMGLESAIKMCVEPGLFEWLAWYQGASWMTVEELLSAGYNVNASYKPYISAEELQNEEEESCEQYYTRSFFVTRCILQATSADSGRKKKTSSSSRRPTSAPSSAAASSAPGGGNVLFVAHAATLDVCTRQMVGEAPRQMDEMMQIIRKVPYCSLGVIEEIPAAGAAAGQSSWKLVEPPVPPMTHTNNVRFNWEVLN